MELMLKSRKYKSSIIDGALNIATSIDNPHANSTLLCLRPASSQNQLPPTTFAQFLISSVGSAEQVISISVWGKLRKAFLIQPPTSQNSLSLCLI